MEIDHCGVMREGSVWRRQKTALPAEETREPRLLQHNLAECLRLPGASRLHRSRGVDFEQRSTLGDEATETGSAPDDIVCRRHGG